MKVAYDKYYQTENFFGNPYPELLEFFSGYQGKGKILDLGCGQGRDAIPIARLGFTVTGVDHSIVGIEQMNQIAKTEGLKLQGKVADIFEFNEFKKYDFVLLDSMFHFAKNDIKKETKFIKRIITEIKDGCLVVFCIQDTGKKVKTLNEVIDFDKELDRVLDKKIEYIFENNEHESKTKYRMIIVKK